MIHVAFDPSTLTGTQKQFWDDWIVRAQGARARRIQVWETWWNTPNRPKKAPPIPAKDQSIWKELRDWLLKHYFHDKCAYCEKKIVKETGDTEHYRPKGRVTFRVKGKKKRQPAHTTDPNNERIEHPGYFWLTHHWLNLLPSCKGCNALEGKLTQFPMRDERYVFLVKLNAGQVAALKETPVESPSWPGFYYLDPRDLEAAEQRLLLHPYNDDPRKHLQFKEGGLPYPRPGGDVEMAKRSIKVYDLRHDSQRVERQIAQENALIRFLNKLATLKTEDGCSLVEARRKAYETLSSLQESAEYSAATRDFVERIRVD